MTITALRQRTQFDHVDAVHRAWRKAQFAAGAVLGERRMHAFRGADNGIDRTGLDAQHAADATRLVNHGGGPGLLQAVRRIERLLRAAEQSRKFPDSRDAARRALIDVGIAAGNRVSVWTAAVVAAFRTLSLRQQRVDG